MKYLILVAAVFSVFDVHVQANYVLNVTLLRWQNPFSIEHNLECCDSRESHPNVKCPYHCQTLFDICLQPDSYSLVNFNCPYGRYSTMYDSSWSNSDNITFIPGVSIKGDVPNPMTFNVPANNTVHLFVEVFEEDITFDHDFIDIVRFSIFLNSSISQVIEKTGQYGAGTLMISYTAYCSTGYYGDYCSTSAACTPTAVSSSIDATSTFTSSSTGSPGTVSYYTSVVNSSTNTAGLYAVSVLLVICFVALVVLIILFFLVVVILQKKIQALKKSDTTPTDTSFVNMVPVNMTGNVYSNITEIIQNS